MISSYFDKTILNLLTILVAGAGLFAVLTKFNVPQLNLTFFNENPYGVKKDAIESVMTWIFTSLALIGLLIQTYNVIFAHNLPERLYQTSYYVKFFIFSLIGTIILVMVLGMAGKFIAKKIWRRGQSPFEGHPNRRRDLVRSFRNPVRLHPRDETEHGKFGDRLYTIRT